VSAGLRECAAGVLRARLAVANARRHSIAILVADAPWTEARFEEVDKAQRVLAAAERAEHAALCVYFEASERERGAL